MASKAKEELGVEELTTLADKGYYTGEDLQKCEEENITAIVARQKLPSNNGNEEYTRDKFKYNKEENTYTCPQGHKLKCVSNKSSKEQKYKNFEACKTCPVLIQCTKSNQGRVITTGKYEEVYQRADKRYAENTELYKRRQMIVEPVFGTVKRALGFSYFLLLGNEKVKAESSMHFLAYNLKRVINIIGTKELTEYMKARISDYFYLITKKRVKFLKISGF